MECEGDVAFLRSVCLACEEQFPGVGRRGCGEEGQAGLHQ